MNHKHLRWTITLFVNGRKAASTNATDARLGSDKSLYIGARPNAAWNVHNFSYPTGFWKGAIDDVRVSRGARYVADFEPDPALLRDSATLFAVHHDQHFGPFVPVDAAPQLQAVISGQPRLATAER